jgi:uncharacterized lipoprotein YmbA
MRRRLAAGLPVIAAMLLAGCAAPLPPLALLRLPPQADPLPEPGRGSGGVWQLLSPVRMPDYLEREALLLPAGRGDALQPSESLRWAEPLRESVTRLLREDLQRMLGDPVWLAPVPPGVSITRQLRVELLSFELDPRVGGVRLRARFSVADPSERAAARVGETELVVGQNERGTDALVRAHRQAIARLAERVSAFAHGVAASDRSR